ncbi:MAG: sulfurtransferase, partial [Acidobacteria bacterium]|nr:sulfurtransferase [Acidobacteriota bacterium]
GYMLGPGVGALVSRMVRRAVTAADRQILDELTPARDFGAAEALE